MDNERHGDWSGRRRLGGLVGGGLLVLWNVKGWGSVRAIPGVNTHEDVSA
ncbi:MAG TPA: hypothetical protein VK279_02460 [Solirubrobacteraceae bacterium]|nr:hypothetical protein [Solirubrobacteraceae bacterium]